MNTSHRPRAARIGASIVAAMLLGMFAMGPVRADTASELKAAEASLNKLIDKIAAENKTIDTYNAQISDIAGQMDRIQSRIARTQGKILTLEEDLRLATNQLLGTQAQLDARAWVAYENGPGSNLAFLLGSTSLSDLSDRLEIVNRVAQTDQELITQIQNQQTVLQQKQQSLQALQTQLQGTQAELKSQQAALQSKEAAAQNVVDGLNKDKAAADKLVTKLKAKRAAEIAAALAAAESSGGGSGSIGGVLLACPVDPPRGYTDDFGAPRYGGGFHQHAGQDIFAPRGTPIRSPFPGTAEASTNGLGGLTVTITGSAGYVYNAHMDGYAGSFPRAVGTGEIVGYVGNSGDAQGGATHDHFEWHPNVVPSSLWKSPYGATQIGTAIDPFPYLNSVC